MKKISTIFLQVVIAALGIAALAVMIRFPLTEGRAVNLDLFHIYADPFLMYGYLSSIAFFAALYQAFKLLEKEHKAEVAILRTFWKSHYLSVGHRCLGKMLVGNFGKVDK